MLGLPLHGPAWHNPGVAVYPTSRDAHLGRYLLASVLARLGPSPGAGVAIGLQAPDDAAMIYFKLRIETPGRKQVQTAAILVPRRAFRSPLHDATFLDTARLFHSSAQAEV